MSNLEPYQPPNVHEHNDSVSPSIYQAWPVVLPVMIQAALFTMGIAFALLENQIISLPDTWEVAVYYGLILIVVGIFACPTITVIAAFLTRIQIQAKFMLVFVSITLSVFQVMLFRFAVP